MRWPLYFVSNKIKNSLHRVSLMPLDGCRRFGAIEFERHDNHEKTIQLYPGTVRVREAFVLRSIEVYPWFNDLVTVLFLNFLWLLQTLFECVENKKKVKATRRIWQILNLTLRIWQFRFGVICLWVAECLYGAVAISCDSGKW